MNLISRRSLRNLLVTAGLVVTSTVYYVHDGIGNSSGVSGATDRPSTTSVPGCGCHSTEPAAGTAVRITTDATSFEPGKTYRFKVTVTNPEKLAGGVNIAKWLTGKADTSSAFKLITGQGLKTIGGFQLSHSSPKPFVEGSTSWEFEYTTTTNTSQAPDTLYAISNAVNDNGTRDDGDHWNLAPKYVINLMTNSVSPRNDIAEAFAIGPNPTRGLAKLHFMMKKTADLRIAIVDASGREVYLQHRDGLTYGRGDAMIDLTNLPDGDYLVNVTSKGALLYTGKLAHTK
jgi:hypothetical protein